MRQDRDTDGNGTLDETRYVLNDVNFNVIAVVDPTSPTSTISERYSYNAYGNVIVLNKEFVVQSIDSNVK